MECFKSFKISQNDEIPYGIPKDQNIDTDINKSYRCFSSKRSEPECENLTFQRFFVPYSLIN